MYINNSYSYKLHKETSINSPFGLVTKKVFSETVGFSFLETEKYSIELLNGQIQIYKAQRMFQENEPVVHELSVSDNIIKWNDGIFFYNLQITPEKL